MLAHGDAVTAAWDVAQRHSDRSTDRHQALPDAFHRILSLQGPGVTVPILQVSTPRLRARGLAGPQSQKGLCLPSGLCATAGDSGDRQRGGSPSQHPPELTA